jgi:phage terminase large subunit
MLDGRIEIAEGRATLEREGIDNIAAFKDISPGIEAIRSRLRRANDGKPRLFIVSGALVEVDAELEKSKKPWSTDQEFEVYAYPKSIEGKPTKDLPVKDYDHGMDAMRYAVAYIDDLQTTTYLPDNPKNLNFGPIHRQFDNWLSPTKMPMF